MTGNMRVRGIGRLHESEAEGRGIAYPRMAAWMRKKARGFSAIVHRLQFFVGQRGNSIVEARISSRHITSTPMAA